MKKTLLLIFILAVTLLINEKTFSQQGWIQTSSGTTNNLRQVVFYNSLTGWTVGFGGVVLKTTNAGNTWTVQNPGTGVDLYSITIGDSVNLYACGAGGTIIKTTNGGAVWVMLNSGTNVTLRSLDCPTGTPRECRAVGDAGVIRYTSNFGATWTVESYNTTKNINSVHLLGAQTGWAVGDSGGAYVSGGNMFTETDNLTSVTRNSYICSDKGNFYRYIFPVWRKVQVAANTKLYSLSQFGSNVKKIWASGENGTVKYSNDTGNTWVSPKYSHE